MSDRHNANTGTFPGVSETSLKELRDKEFQNLINLSYPASLRALNVGSVSDGDRNKQVWVYRQDGLPRSSLRHLPYK